MLIDVRSVEMVAIAVIAVDKLRMVSTFYSHKGVKKNCIHRIEDYVVFNAL